MIKTREDYRSEIARPKFNEKAWFEWKGQFLKELHDNTFSGTNGDDVVEHIENFLKIVDVLDIPNVTHDQLRLSIFPILLIGCKLWIAILRMFYGIIGREEMMKRIDTDIFHFETLLCKAFKELNYILKIDDVVLIEDIPGFKTYKEYKDDWIYEWNNGISWVDEKPWIDGGIAEWTTCNWKEDGYYNTGDLPGMIRERNSIQYQDYEWYDALVDSDLKNEVLINKSILEESSKDPPIQEYKDYEHTTYIETDWFDEHELMDDHNDDLGDLEDYLIQKDPLYYVNEDEERSNERRCKLLGIPYVKPPTCKSEKFKVVKYSFGPAEEYVTVKEYEYDIWVQTKENVSQIYHDIFCKKDEGWSVTRTK
ncbi:hypothetical protein Tco_1321019 [Tanacetum coccineum]